MIFYIKIKFPVDNPTDTLAIKARTIHHYTCMWHCTLNNKVTLSQKCFCSGFKQHLGWKILHFEQLQESFIKWDFKKVLWEYVKQKFCWRISKSLNDICLKKIREIYHRESWIH